MGIFDPEKISAISIRGLGRISPNRNNERRAHCVQCGATLEVGNGFQFRAERFARLRSGYFCQVCIGGILRSVHGWFFNKHFEILQPVIFDKGRAVNGETLAEIWLRGGSKALFERVTPLSFDCAQDERK